VRKQVCGFRRFPSKVNRSAGFRETKAGCDNGGGDSPVGELSVAGSLPIFTDIRRPQNEGPGLLPMGLAALQLRLSENASIRVPERCQN
jgi:hypothetical protein